MPGEVAFQESFLERVTRIPTKLWKRPLISLSKVQRVKVLRLSSTLLPKGWPSHSKDHSLEHCRRKNPCLVGRRKRQAACDCGETIVNICMKAPLVGKALLREEPACQISTDKSAHKKGVTLRLRKRRPASTSKHIFFPRW